MFIFFSGCIILNIMFVIKYFINLSIKLVYIKVGLYYCIVFVLDRDLID